MIQLTMAFPLQKRLTAADLLPNAAQDEAQAWLARSADWPLRRLALWGPLGTGKTHLVHAWAERVGGRVLAAAPSGGWPDRPVAIDGIDAITDEIALLHLLNAAAEARLPVLLASTTAPGRLPVRLPDLASRLRATTAVAIGPAEDGFLRALLGRLLAERQLRVPEALQTWLLTRLVRSPGAVRDAVLRLDAAALEQGRTITRPWAASVLGLHDGFVAEAEPGSPRVPGCG